MMTFGFGTKSKGNKSKTNEQRNQEQHNKGNHPWNEMKTIYQMGENISNDIFDRGLYPKYINNLYNSVTKK